MFAPVWEFVLNRCSGNAFLYNCFASVYCTTLLQYCKQYSAQQYTVLNRCPGTASRSTLLYNCFSSLYCIKYTASITCTVNFTVHRTTLHRVTLLLSKALHCSLYHNISLHNTTQLNIGEHFWKLDSISANQGREERRLIEILSSEEEKNQSETASRWSFPILHIFKSS